MSLVPSLLQAIVRANGEALVMHAGEKPYVVSPTGQVELASRGLTLDAVNGIVAQLLPGELLAALDEFGAVQCELPDLREFPAEHFTVVAARGGDDIWVEIRRRRVIDDDAVPEELFGPSASPPSAAIAATQAALAVAAPTAAVPNPAMSAAAQQTVPRAPAQVAPPAVAAAAVANVAVAAAAVANVAAASQVPTPPAARVASADTTDDDLLMPDATHLWGELSSAASHTRTDAEVEINIDADMDNEAAAVVPPASVHEWAAPAAAPRATAAPQVTAEKRQPITAAPVVVLPPVVAPPPVAVAAVAAVSPVAQATAPAARPVVAPVASSAVAHPQVVRSVPAAQPPAAITPPPRVVAKTPAVPTENTRAADAPAPPLPVAQTPAVQAKQPIAAAEPPVVEIPATKAKKVAAVAPPSAAAPADELAMASDATIELSDALFGDDMSPSIEEAAVIDIPIELSDSLFGTSVAAMVEPAPAAEEMPIELADALFGSVAAANLEAPAIAAEAMGGSEQPLAGDAVASGALEQPAIPAETHVEAAEVAEVGEVVDAVAILAAPQPPSISVGEPLVRPGMPLEIGDSISTGDARAIGTDEPAMTAQMPVDGAAPYDSGTVDVSAPPIAAEVPFELAETLLVEEDTSIDLDEPAIAAEMPFELSEALLLDEWARAIIEQPPAEAEMLLDDELTGELPPLLEEPLVAAAAAYASSPALLTSAPRAMPPQPAVVLPIARSPIRSDQPPPPMSDPTLSGLERLLRVAAARGASTLYLSSGSRPSVRVDGELQVLDGEPVHVGRDVESLLLTLMPERSHEALRTGAATEWICDLEGVGRVRCVSFRDQLGPGGVFRMMPTRSVSAEQLGLPAQVQALAAEPEGLVLVAGPRSSGKRTLMAAFVNLMNRSRRDHIITIEREINILHERGSSFISQREVRGRDEDMVAAARSALREDPDVLVIEDLRTRALMNVALEAAASGRLVVGGFSAHTAAGTVDRIIDLYAPEQRHQVQLAVADALRGVIVQVLLRKTGGGRLPAREVLLNTPAVSSVIAEGKTSQLPMAIEGGRRYGMMPLNDALVGLVQNGAVDAGEAYRHSPDRAGFLAALNRNGIDTSFVERLA